MSLEVDGTAAKARLPWPFSGSMSVEKTLEARKSSHCEYQTLGILAQIWELILKTFAVLQKESKYPFVPHKNLHHACVRKMNTCSQNTLRDTSLDREAVDRQGMGLPLPQLLYKSVVKMKYVALIRKHLDCLEYTPGNMTVM